MAERTILIVDDDSGQRTIHRYHLEKLGLQVEEAATESGAMEKLKLIPDVVALDIHLDEQNHDNKHGYRIAREAQKQGIKNIVIASASSSPSDHVEGVEIIGKQDLAGWVKKKLGL